MECDGIPRDQRQVLRDVQVCVTGRLACLTQQQLAALVTECGGKFLRRPVRSPFLLVLGEAGWPSRRDGSPTRIFQRARELQAQGIPIEFLSEREFYQRLGMVEESAIHARHTLADLARILEIPAARLQRWLRLGLITPVETVHRLSYFDFQQAASARHLCDLLADGAELREIRAGLEQLRQWLPANPSFDQLSLLEHDGRILLRLEQGLMEPSGQRLLDFEASEASAGGDTLLAFRESSVTVDDLFHRALAAEDGGYLDEALQAYDAALELDPTDAVVRFNRGNVLFGLGRLDAAMAGYREALARDPQYAEAWNNLGNVLAEAGRLEESVQALRKAIQFVPSYADAHFNLAQVLAKLGDARAATRHRNLYERLCAK